VIERNHWHPVASINAVGATPLAVRLLDQELVLWRDQADAVHAFADQCPHRGARLSLGRVIESRLECAYHGWQFDAQAQCRVIPATPELSPSPSLKACHYPTRLAYDLIWVQMGPIKRQGAGHLQSGSTPLPTEESENIRGIELPLFAAENDRRLRKTSCGPYWVDTSAPRIVENFLDMAHFGYVHEHWLGDRAHTSQSPYKVKVTDTGLLSTQCFAWQPKSSLHATGGSMVEYTYEVVSPYCAVLTKLPEPTQVAIADFKESIALFVCPVEPERSLVWFRLAMNDFVSPDQDLQSFQDTIFSQDKPILESQTPKRLPLDPKGEMHSAADKASVAYRRYLKRLGIQFGVC
jgi:phenylpropionate dioxygenase-like ring-hydroxylating dioxygenase large terminal subunit